MIRGMYAPNLSASMRTEQNNIIVIGGDHHNTLGVIRSLGYKGLYPNLVVVTNHKKPYVSYSKYIQQYHILTSANDIVDYLLKTKSTYDSKQVVISCADCVTAILDTHQEQLSAFYHLPVGKGNIVQVMNKDTMANIAKECGLVTPRTIMINDVSFSNHIKYIFKPLKSIEGSKADIAVVKSKEELNTFLSYTQCEKFQIQEYIEKNLEFQLIGCSLNEGKTIIIPGVSIILRQPENTNTGFLKYISLDEFQFDEIEKCKKFIQTIGYSGLFSMEFLRGKDGKDYFMEINMRNDGNSICVTSAGVNLPFIWYNYNIGKKEWMEESKKTIKETLVMPEFDDFVNVLKSNISLRQWIRDVRQTDCFMEYDKSDMKPFYVGLLQQFSNYFKLFFRKLHIIK